jgi:hypothetical protein
MKTGTTLLLAIALGLACAAPAAAACAAAQLGEWHGYIDSIAAPAGTPSTQDVTFSICDDTGAVQAQRTVTLSSPLNKTAVKGTIDYAVHMARYPVADAPSPTAGTSYTPAKDNLPAAVKK